ncbi:MarR family transcriptional regulator [Roseibium polysiphoniae]|uniref:MarR family transcriptional regulator n=1 Tax=Roseibium polysiphoniae TaxID=2571221 RepID=A0ABR9CDW4_9HYPH|nr:MarR family transcriptional regulator [Roseibium polysiphoniae]
MQFRVFALLCRSANRAGHTIRSQVKMAAELRASRSTVCRAIDQLEKFGWVQRIQNRRPDGGKCSLGYVINHEGPAETTNSEQTTRNNCAMGRSSDGSSNDQGMSHGSDITKNTQFKNTQIKTDFIDTCGARHADDTPVHCLNRSSLHAIALDQQSRNFIENVKQQLLFVGIHLEHSSISGGVGTILEWYEMGADVELDIAPMLEKVISRAKAQPTRLAYFTKAIRNSVKRRSRGQATYL